MRQDFWKNISLQMRCKCRNEVLENSVPKDTVKMIHVVAVQTIQNASPRDVETTFPAGQGEHSILAPAPEGYLSSQKGLGKKEAIVCCRLIL